jgi:hypothetical protein
MVSYIFRNGGSIKNFSFLVWAKHYDYMSINYLILVEGTFLGFTVPRLSSTPAVISIVTF